jgi:hypothetical protein
MKEGPGTLVPWRLFGYFLGGSKSTPVVGTVDFGAIARGQKIYLDVNDQIIAITDNNKGMIYYRGNYKNQFKE